MKAKFQIQDKILVIKYDQGVDLNLEDVEMLKAERQRIMHGLSMPVYVDVNGIKSITKQARDFYSTSKSLTGIRAIAFFSNSTLANFLSDYVIKTALQKTDVPVKSFHNEEEALTWLREFL